MRIKERSLLLLLLRVEIRATFQRMTNGIEIFHVVRLFLPN